MKTLITYYGGKQQLVPHLLKSLPKNFSYYCEAFAGGLALFFAKRPSEFEIINDTNQMVINFYEIYRSNFEELKEKVEATLFSRASYKVALTMYQMPHLFSKLQLAWAFFYLTQCGFAAQIGSFGFDKKGKRPVAFHNKKLRFSDIKLVQRLEKVLIENKDAVDIIKTYDSPEMLFYLDPPYVSDGTIPKVNQGHYKNYRLEDYTNLLNALSQISGKFLLSSYPSELLNTYIQKHGWYSKEIIKPLSAQKVKNGKKRKTKREIITANYPI